MSGQKYYVWLALLCCSLSVQLQADQKVKTPMHLLNTPDVVAQPFMQRIPAGDFLMGSPPSEKYRGENEGPQHRVQVAAFELGETEVTVGQFRTFVEERAYVTDAQRNAGNRKGCPVWDRQKGEWVWKADYNWNNPGYTQTEEHPVVCVSWDDTQAYIKWLNQQTGQQYRLPSEAEWEYAARAGSQTPFAFGACIYTDQANYDGNYDYANCGAKTGVNRRGTVAVDALQAANAWGLRHMHGNVYEWAQDCWHENYEDAPRDGQAWLTEGNCSLRMLRGGSWDDFPGDLRAANRLWINTGFRFNFAGFRLAKTL